MTLNNIGLHPINKDSDKLDTFRHYDSIKRAVSLIVYSTLTRYEKEELLEDILDMENYILDVYNGEGVQNITMARMAVIEAIDSVYKGA